MAEEYDEYPCSFSLTEDCPVRRLWKLRPESLVLFCRICPLLQGKSLREIKEKIGREEG